LLSTANAESSFLLVLQQPMKKWYNTYAPVKEKFGAFPLFWQELKAWPHYKKVKKLYLIATEAGGNERLAAEMAKLDGGDGGAPAIVTAPSAADTATAAPADSPASPAVVAPTTKRRRKSRWGGEKETKGDEASTGKKRKTRWSSESDKQLVVPGWCQPF
jgi:hypothetical protein